MELTNKKGFLQVCFGRLDFPQMFPRDSQIVIRASRVNVLFTTSPRMNRQGLLVFLDGFCDRRAAAPSARSLAFDSCTDFRTAFAVVKPLIPLPGHWYLIPVLISGQLLRPSGR